MGWGDEMVDWVLGLLMGWDGGMRCGTTVLV